MKPVFTKNRSAVRLKILLLHSALIMPPDESFKHQFNKDGVDVLFAKTDLPNPWIRGVTQIKHSFESIVRVLGDIGNYHKIFSEHLGESRILSHSNSEITAYFVWPLSFPMQDRDAVVSYSVLRNIESNSALVKWSSSSHSNDPKAGLRIQNVAGETQVGNCTNDYCIVSYTYYGDLGGDLMQWIKERAWREEPIYYLNKVKMALDSTSDPKKPAKP